MLTIDLQGAQVLLDLLRRIREEGPVPESEMEDVLAANAFFVDFYSRWEGNDRETIKQTICHFDQPDQVPPGFLTARLAQGFREAMDELDLIQGRLSWLAEIDASAITERVLAFLPDGTPLDSVIHMTVDRFNSAFAYRDEIGVSLLHGAADSKTFQDSVAHELHHVGFRYWSDRDMIRQALLQEKTGRAVAAMHVQNLLSEGLANYYCTPEGVFRASPGEPPADPFQARLARLQREEGALFTQAEAVLARSLEPGAGYGPCWEMFKTIAFDMEDAMLPAGHYLGARMVQTMDPIYPRSQILSCIEHLPDFLPLYNQAARQAGTFCFDPRLLGQFAQLWDMEKTG